MILSKHPIITKVIDDLTELRQTNGVWTIAGELAASPDSWDVAFMGVASSRAKTVAFSDPYVEIPCSFLVPMGEI